MPNIDFLKLSEEVASSMDMNTALGDSNNE